MDYLYHAVVGLGISKTLTGAYDPSAAFFALLPDIVGTAPLVYSTLKNAPHRSLTEFTSSLFKLTKTNVFVNSFDQSVYRATHSLLCTLILTVLLYVLFPKNWLILSLSYLSHVLVDVPSHYGDFATRLLYPFSDMHYEGKNWATDPRAFTFFWLILLVAIALFAIV